MRGFVTSLGVLISIIILFIVGSLLNASWLMIVMCPGGLLALWINGFLAAKSGIKVSVENNNGKATKQRREFQ